MSAPDERAKFLAEGFLELAGAVVRGASPEGARKIERGCEVIDALLSPEPPAEGTTFAPRIVLERARVLADQRLSPKARTGARLLAAGLRVALNARANTSPK